MASLEQISELLAKQAADFEAKMTEALEAQEARLTAQFGKSKEQDLSSGKKPIEVEEEETSELSPEDKKVKERLEQLEKSLAKLKTHKDGLDLDSLSLFPKARLPPKFHMPNMDKFDGTTCPKTHLKNVCGCSQPTWPGQ